MIPLGVLASAYVAPAGGGGGAYDEEVLADSPLMYWRLGEASGITAADASGNSRDGTYVGTYTLGAAGAITGDTAVGFTAGSVRCGAESWMNASNITAEAIVKTTTTAKAQIVCRDSGGSSTRQFQFAVSADGTLRGIVWNTGGTVAAVSSTGTVNDGNWHHVALVANGSTIKTYIDGSEDGSTAQTAVRSITYDLRAAALGNGSAERFNGTIDEVAYYGTALSPARILAHAQAAGVA